METRKQDEVGRASAPSPQTPPSKKWLWVVVSILVVLLVVVLLIPAILSSTQFTRWVQARISRSTGGQAQIGDLSVGWIRGIQIDDFRYRGQNGWTEVNVPRITTSPYYAGLLGGALGLGRTVLDQPQVAINLQERPPATEQGPVDVNELQRLREIVVRDGHIRLTDATGQTVQLANLSADLRVRPPGQTSRVNAGMTVLAANQPPGQVTVAGQATPSKKKGWSLGGTTGQITVDVNNLNLASVTPFLNLLGIQVRALGQVSGTITSAIQNGRIENVGAAILGRDFVLTGSVLDGDELRTSQLNVQANLAQSANLIAVSRLDVRTDWAVVSLSGRIPKTAGSLSELLQSGSAYELTGNFDVNLAPVLSQMPKTLGVRPGLEITGGQATGSVNTATRDGQAVLTAKAQVAGLAGVVNDQKVSLSAPILTALELSPGRQGPRIDSLNITAPFATIDASGDFQRIQYQARTDLTSLQSQLGPFLNLGPYRLAGQVTSQGQLALEQNLTGLTGTLSAQQLVLTAPDGNSIAEPQANVEFALDLDRQRQALAIQNLTARAGFGTISLKDGVVPFGPNSTAPLRLTVLGNDVDLGRLEPYGVLFASLPKDLQIAGIAQAQVMVTEQQGVYHLTSDATRIQDFVLATPGEPPFRQTPVTASFDVFVNPSQKTIDVQRLLVESPQIKIQKGQFTQTRQGATVKAQGALDGQVDWAAVAPLMSTLVPGQLTVAGRRPIAINFTSVYPANEPNGLLAHLNSQASFGFDRAAYIGFDFGPTQLDIRSQEGLMTIGPISTAVNNGKLNFVGHANLRASPPVLTTPTLVHVAQAVQINEQTAKTLLKYVNPIFADAVRVSGVANFDVQQMTVPLTANARTGTNLNGTIWIEQLHLGASSILGQIFTLAGQSISSQTLTVHPTALVLQNGVVRYDNMQIDVGQNPVNFRGSIGLNGALNMTIVLPYTATGRLVRVGQPQTEERIVVPLTGTISKPQLNLQKFLESQVQQQVLRGLGELLKKR